MKQKKLSMSERIEDELKYSNKLKEKSIENKTKEKKNSNVQKKLNFDFKSEYNFLNDQQSKLENEILFQLEEFEKSDVEKLKAEELTEDFYSLTILEKKIKSEFNKNLKSFYETFQSKDNFPTKTKIIEGVLKDLKIFNKSLIKIDEEELNFLLYKDEFILNNSNTTLSENKKEICIYNLAKNIISFDHFNLFKINDIDYIIQSEIKSNKIFTHNLKFEEKIGNFLNKTEDEIIKKILQLDKYNLKNKLSQILNKSLIILGSEETDQIILNLNRANELTFLKFEMEYKNLFSQFNNNFFSQKKVDTEIFSDMLFNMKINNFAYLSRSSLIPREKLFQRLQDEFPKHKKEKLAFHLELTDAIYDFRLSKEILFKNYHDEIKEFLKNSSNLVYEAINSEIKEIQENIKKREFLENKEENRVLNEKNKEVFEIKQRIKEENEAKEKDRIKYELEKKEKESNKYYSVIKDLSQRYQSEKREKDIQEKSLLKNETIQKDKRLKEEIKIKLPLIAKRQTTAESQFLVAYKQKEVKKEEKMKRELTIKNIAENLKVRPMVEIDPERVRRVTEALRIRLQTKLDKGDKVVLFKNNGFTIDNLMSDLRYKISTALNEAGLLNNEYSNRLLVGLSNLNK